MKGRKSNLPGEELSAPVALRQVNFLNTSGDSTSAGIQNGSAAVPTTTTTTNNNNNNNNNNDNDNASQQYTNPSFMADEEQGGQLQQDTPTMTIPEGNGHQTNVIFSPQGKLLSPLPGNNKKMRTESMASDEVDKAKSELGSVRFDDEFYNELDSLSLCYSRLEKVALKNFSNEVRATMDVEQYLRNSVLLFNLNASSLNSIVQACLTSCLGESSSPLAYDQATSAMFTQDCVHQLSRTLHSTSPALGGGFAYDQHWIGILCTVPALTTRQVVIARLLHPVNFGSNSQEVQFVVLILGTAKEKGTKSELEVARTFGTIFASIDIRQELLAASTEDEFKKTLRDVTHTLSTAQSKMNFQLSMMDLKPEKVKCGFMKGLVGDLKRRIPHYFSDFKDGVADCKSILKTMSCTLFLYFACILPSIAFGVLNFSNTEGTLTVEKVLCSQVFGGLVFAFIGGTPQIVLLTTAPLAIYTQIIFSLSDQFDIDFKAFFACVGLFNCFFLILFSIFDLSIFMQYSTRSSEEIFALFISIAFSVDAFKALGKNVDENYNCDPATSASNGTNSTLLPLAAETDCPREVTLLYILLLFGTLWLGVTLFQFKNTPFLTPGKREMLADYALPVAVIFMAFLGAYVFKKVDVGKSFETMDGDFSSLFEFVDLSSLGWEAVLGSCGLGFCLSLLFFMDQNISAALVNAPQNKMLKGTSYHWDLMVIALINGVLSLLCFPWVHAALPHSPLHVLALADVEERVDQGHIYQTIVKVRETRLTGIFSHILIAVSFLFLSELSYIPNPVLYGLFLYVAVTALYGNQMFERIQLFFTEQSAYPPSHYICRVPQRKMHLFTTLQLLQLLVLCAVGFAPYPYLKMFFPVLIFCLIPLRHKVIPKLVKQKYLKALDGH